MLQETLVADARLLCCQHHVLQADADLAIIAALLDDFRSHPVRRAYKGVALTHGVTELSSHPKVSHLHLSRLRQQDVATLDIPVHLLSTNKLLHAQVQQSMSQCWLCSTDVQPMGEWPRYTSRDLLTKGTAAAALQS